MKTVIRLILIFVLIFAVYLYVKARSWDELDKEFSAAYRQARYAEADTVARQQLKAAEQIFFFSRFYIPPSLNNLGRVAHSQKRYAEAESYYKRAIEMAESALGKNNYKLVVILENMAKLYRELGKKEDSQKLLDRVKIIRALQ